MYIEHYRNVLILKLWEDGRIKKIFIISFNVKKNCLRGYFICSYNLIFYCKIYNLRDLTFRQQ